MAVSMTSSVSMSMSSSVSMSVSPSMGMSMSSSMGMSVTPCLLPHMRLCVCHNLLDIVVIYRILLLRLVGLLGPLERRVRLVVSVRVSVAASSVRVSMASSVRRDSEGEAPQDDEHDGDAGDSPPRRYRCRHHSLY